MSLISLSDRIGKLFVIYHEVKVEMWHLGLLV